MTQKQRQDKLNQAWCKYMGKCSTEIMQALAFAMRWCDEHPQWISVEDELPEANEAYGMIGYPEVLVALDDGYVGMTHYDSVNEYWGDYDGEVEYWMPLPQPPTVAKNATVEKGDKQNERD